MLVIVVRKKAIHGPDVVIEPYTSSTYNITAHLISTLGRDSLILFVDGNSPPRILSSFPLVPTPRM